MVDVKVGVIGCCLFLLCFFFDFLFFFGWDLCLLFFWLDGLKLLWGDCWLVETKSSEI